MDILIPGRVFKLKYGLYWNTTLLIPTDSDVVIEAVKKDGIWIRAIEPNEKTHNQSIKVDPAKLFFAITGSESGLAA